ncbi:TransThyretin-Related family domain [Caenorhabditis elegans]|uniref:TransThyretin-Related family domain n=2 Tax=Caenorhabditis elegans TaxID=6239 RepID=Q23540_CAEEL|nr:TransThyretin-Related family domain [Caenorhabditis elegans]CAA93425.4 TransThyretin-Related family domain [Caenorhabditis elegans]|eukprot:NP_001255518.1 Uncharacterized protein CELE_ZK593.2 [Caenorhabditis elegans]
MINSSLLCVFLCILISAPFTRSRPSEEHPMYTAARLTDEYKHILDGKIKLAESHIFTDDVTVDDCGKGGNFDYLSDKLDSLIPTLSEINVSVKFAYPVPFTNNTIEFSIDEILTLHDGNVQQGEKAFFARTDEKDDKYRIYDIRAVPCYSSQ